MGFEKSYEITIDWEEHTGNEIEIHKYPRKHNKME